VNATVGGVSKGNATAGNITERNDETSRVDDRLMAGSFGSFEVLGGYRDRGVADGRSVVNSVARRRGDLDASACQE
jgi:hypothetical protein